MTLRRRLLALVIAATLPAACVIAWRGWTDTVDRAADIQQTALVQSQLLASELTQIIDGKRQLLLSLSKIRSVRENENPRCSTLLREIHEAVEGNAFLAVLDARGMVVCGSLVSRENSADRPFFLRALDTGGFTVGDYEIGRHTANPSLNFSLAMQSAAGRTQVLTTAMNLGWLDQRLAERALPRGVQVVVTDRNGVVLARTPGAPDGGGQQVATSRLGDVAQPAAGGLERTDADHETWAVGFAPVLIGGEKVLHVEVSSPIGPAMAEIRHAVLRQQGMYGAAMLLALLLVWWWAERRVRHPMAQLLSTVRAWGDGNLAARTGLPYSRNEFGRLAATFDTIGADLETRTKQLAIAKERAEIIAERLRIVDRAVQASSSPIILVDARGDDQPIVFVNPAFERATQYSADEAIGRNCRFLRHDSSDEGERDKLRAALRADARITVQLHNRRKDGSSFQCELHVAPVYNQIGAVTHFVGWLLDLSERDAAQRREHEANALLMQVMEATTDAVVAVGPDRRITYLNDNARLRLAPDKAMIGEDLWALFVDTDRSMFRDAYERVRTERVPVSFETFYPPRRSWFHVHAHPTHGGMTIFFRDIGPRKQAEAALVAAKKQAEAASQAKSNFLATMSHELRTPLNAVIGFAEIIAAGMRGPISPLYAEYGQDIGHSARHLLQVINDVLDISKIEAGRLELDETHVSLDDVVLGCAQLIRGNAAEREMRVACELSGGLMVRADPLRLRQALLNLLSNAIKFGHAGGVVTVAVSRNDDGDACITVSDRGIGMSAEQIPVALQAFGQIQSAFSRTYEGTGLGLPIAKQLVELHDGALLIDSEPGEGTRVTICLPAARIVTSPSRA
ncbi:MAG: pdhS [Rhodospirillales bacterium]|nr:pdhS [Rhodospirillales bacterium]